jgi:hypothetical protein
VSGVRPQDVPEDVVRAYYGTAGTPEEVIAAVLTAWEGKHVADRERQWHEHLWAPCGVQGAKSFLGQPQTIVLKRCGGCGGHATFTLAGEWTREQLDAG